MIIQVVVKSRGVPFAPIVAVQLRTDVEDVDILVR
jgi:hypothetical protein